MLVLFIPTMTYDLRPTHLSMEQHPQRLRGSLGLDNHRFDTRLCFRHGQGPSPPQEQQSILATTIGMAVVGRQRRRQCHSTAHGRRTRTGVVQMRVLGSRLHQDIFVLFYNIIVSVNLFLYYIVFFVRISVVMVVAGVTETRHVHNQRRRRRCWDCLHRPHAVFSSSRESMRLLQESRSSDDDNSGSNGPADSDTNDNAMDYILSGDVRGPYRYYR